MVKVAKKEINREKLLNHGVLLLTEQGYHGTGLNEILAAVQIPKGSFYNYFASKEAFGAEVIRHYIDPFIQLLNSYLQNPKLDALTALQSYFDYLIEQLEKTGFKGGCLLGNLMGEIGDTSDACRIALNSAVQDYQDLLALGLQYAQDQGHVRTDKSAEVMASLLANAWQGALLRMKIEQSCEPLRECCNNLLGDYFKV